MYEGRAWAGTNAGANAGDDVRTDVAEVVPVSREDPFLRTASAGLGGPLGKHARSRSNWWTPLRVLIALVIASSVLMYLQKLPCRDQNWNGFQYSHACYNDVFPLYGGEGLAAGDVPYFDTHPGSDGQPANVEYPVLIGAAMELGAKIVSWSDTSEPAQRFVDVTWLLLMVAAVIAVIATALTHRRRPWDAALLAAAPGLILAGLINWDLLAVAFLAVAMLAWSRKRPVLSGVFFGLAVATKFYPLLLFAPLFFLCVRGRQLKPFFTCVAGGIVAWSAVNVPVAIMAWDGFKTFYVFSHNRGADWGSIWYAFGQMFHYNFSLHQLNTYEAALTIMIVLGVAALIFGARRRPRVPQVFFLTLALFLIVNKVYSPQYVLWLLPLFALARPRWRAFLFWQFAEAIYFVAIWLLLLDNAHPGKGLEWQPYVVALWIRAFAVLFMCALIVIDIVRPDHDVVRMDGDDDPAGGVLDGASDIFTKRIDDAEPEPALAGAG